MKQNNIEHINKKYYLSVVSQKTQTKTRVLLPEYAVDILRKYKKSRNRLLPIPEKNTFNTRLKKLAEEANWTHETPKLRMKRGKPVELTKANGKAYRFCDMVSSHCMRRTAITTMLRLGLEENLVRKVSGHAAGSKEFYKYVQLGQSFMDEKLKEIHAQIINQELNSLTE